MDFKNPPYKLRVACVALAFAIPGILPGALITLFISFPGGVWSGCAAGLVVGALAGSWLEARR